MFDWYWYFAFYLVVFHFTTVSHSVYMHRTIGHGYFSVSAPLSYFFRFWLWCAGWLGSNWAETYTSRHKKHHATSDTAQDPHSPYHMTFSEMMKPWVLDTADVKRYCPGVITPQDWFQTNVIAQYPQLGPWVLHVIALILFGLPGFLLSILIRNVTKSWLGMFLGNYALHKIGFTYAGNINKEDRSKIVFPIALLLGGEELHANHHNYPSDYKFSRRWFEFDVGYMYAKIFSSLGLLTIRKI